MRSLILITSVFLSVSFNANAAPADVCEKAAKKMEMVIDDWYSFVKSYKAEAKNPSVLAMHKDFKNGSLNGKFNKSCKENWASHSDVYTCFSGIASELSAAMCLHPDTNKKGWAYQP